MFRYTTNAENLDTIEKRLHLNGKTDKVKKQKSKKQVNVYLIKDQKRKKEYEVDLTNVLDNKIEIAYKEACENRRFEIQMYWHRAAYFWAFIAAIYTAFFFISGKDGCTIVYKEAIKLALSLLGFMFCFGFYFANVGSKAWQENWEIHEGLLEDEVAVKLYKTFHYDEKKNYSVSKINNILCALLSFASFVFFVATLGDFIEKCFNSYPYCIKIFIFCFFIFTLALFLHIVKKEVCGNSYEPKEINFKQVEYYD